MSVLIFGALVLGLLFAPAAVADEKIPNDLYEKVYEETYARVLVELHPEGGPHIPEGELSVEMAAEQRADIAAAQLKLLSDLSESDTLTLRQYGTVPMMALDVSIDGLSALESAPGVVAVYPDRFSKPSLTESVQLIEGDLAHARSFDGTGTVVAILDSGVEASHPFLAGKVVEEACYSNLTCPDGSSTQVGVGAGAPCADSSAGCYHGTHVAGIAAGKGVNFTGVAPGADIMAVQVFTLSNGSLGAYDSDIIAGLERVYELRDTYNFASINMSLGGSNYSAYCDSVSPSMKAVIDNLRSAGIATAIASGNDYLTGAISFPSCISSAVSVGSTTKSDSVSFFTNEANFMSLWAPGSSINSSLLGGTFGNLSGTSMATPHVAGAFALLKQAKPTASVDEMLDALQKTGVPIPNYTNEWTTPRIEVDQAISHLFDKAEITSPAPGMKFTSPGVTFNWTTPAGTDTYRLTVGTDVGLSDIFSGGETGAASQAVGGIPESGERVYVRLYTLVNAVWVFADYVYSSSGTALPKIISVNPSVGYIDGGYVVSVLGANFKSGQTSVTFGGAAATEVTVVNSDRLTAKVPVGSSQAAVDVTVTTPDGSATLVDGFRYHATPNVAKLISPEGLLVNNKPTYTWYAEPSATGYRLTVFDNNNTHKIVDLTYTAAEAGCPDGTGTCSATPEVAVADGNGHWHIWTQNNVDSGPESPSMYFSIVSAPPTISKVSPGEGHIDGGASITIKGTGFLSDATVTIGGKPATNVQIVNSTSITATVPDNPLGRADVAVTTSLGTGTLAGGFYYVIDISNDLPAIISPAGGDTITDYTPTYTWQAVLGATVYIVRVGTWFGDEEGYLNPVKFITAADAGCPDGTGICSTNLPAALFVGRTSWSVQGTNNLGHTSYSRSGYFNVAQRGGAISVEPAQGHVDGGTTVTITGSGFESGVTQVSFGGVPATSVNVLSPTTLTAVTPAHAQQEVDVTVITGGTSAALTEGFVFSPYPDQPRPVDFPKVFFDMTPTIKWRPSPGTVNYRIKVKLGGGLTFSDNYYSPANLGCQDSGSLCSFTVDLSSKFAFGYRDFKFSLQGVGSYNGAEVITGFHIAGAPETPSNLSAVALSDTGIRLDWADSSPYDRGFIVDRSSGGGAFTKIATAATDATSYTDSGLTPGTTYTYRVRATNPAGESTDSNSASAATKGVDATKGTEVGQIAVNWAAVSGAVAYNLYRQACATCAKELIASSVTATQFTDATAQAGVTYIYSLQTIDSGGAATDVAYKGTGCKQIPTSLALSKHSFSAPITIGATSTIVAGGDVTVGRSSRVTFHMRRATGGIRLARGFRVRSGGSFRALVSSASGQCS